MSDEDRLRRRLHEQVTKVPIVSDLDDVAARLGRRGRKLTRPVAAAAVAVLVVAALIAVVAERAGHDTPRVRVAGDGGASVAVPTTLPPWIATGAPGGTGSAGPAQGPTGPTGMGATGPTGPTATTLPPNAVPPPVAQPTLPEPGAEQPADPAAARVAITAAFDTLGCESTNQARAAAIEDGPALVPAMEELRSGPYAQQVLSAKTVMLGIVFLSPTRATVEFRSDLGTGGTSGPYVGDAILTPAGWQVSREFYCLLIKQAGVHCP